MSGAHVIAFGAVSALGSGEDAVSVGAIGRPASVAVKHDPAFERAGLLKPVSARAPCVEDGDDRATALLSAALRQCLSQLDPGWQALRIGLAIGTSSGGMATSERLFASLGAGHPLAPEVARGATYFAPLEEVAPANGSPFSPRTLVLGACASSTLAIGIALRWLALDRCDIALAGGFDALTLFVASGFEALRATTASLPRPFRVGRDGMALGEGAGVIALAREAGRRTLGYVAGFAASTDAVHLTAPDATGQGLGAAARFALADASVAPADVDLVSAHATGTPFNDPAETKALARALGDPGAALVHPFKAQIGHTLGAAGVLETLAALDALRRGIAPAAAGEGAIDPECPVRLADTNQSLRAGARTPGSRAGAALKLSAAFGGANAALVLTAEPTPGRAFRSRTAFVSRAARVQAPLDARALADVLAGRHPHLHRLDPLSRLVVSAVHHLSLSIGADVLRGAGLVLGHGLATLEPNAIFDARRRERGARGVEPRRFPATSPNSAAGECAIAFGLTGPTFGVGGSLHGGLEALAVARDLVAAGDASKMLVVAADLAGPTSSALLGAAGVPPVPEGACACLLTAEPGLAAAFPLERPVPSTLGERLDWVWSPPWGHLELGTYLDGVASAASRAGTS